MVNNSAECKTSTYFEGDYTQSQLVEFGYNRDKKKGYKQVVLALICNDEGCPVACEIFPGNTQDATTVMEKIKELEQTYGIENFIFVGDRGMITQGNLKKLKGADNVYSITALTHGQLKELLEKKVIQLELFDEKNIQEVIDPEDPKVRYCLCKNPYRGQKDKQTREALMKKVEENLQEVAHYKRATRVEKLGARVGRILEKYKGVGALLQWEIKADREKKISKEHELIWHWDETKVQGQEQLDGCSIITSDVANDTMSAEEVVHSYKALGLVEKAFRNLKTVQLEMRPVYHHKDDRIRAHLFLCMLSYYVQWHLQECLKPLFDQDKTESQRRWTLSNVIDKLKQITCNRVMVQEACFTKITEADEDQQRILELMSVRI